MRHHLTARNTLINLTAVAAAAIPAVVSSELGGAFLAAFKAFPATLINLYELTREYEANLPTPGRGDNNR